MALFASARPLFGSQLLTSLQLTARSPVKQFKTRGGAILAPEWALWKDPTPPLGIVIIERESNFIGNLIFCFWCSNTQSVIRRLDGRQTLADVVLLESSLECCKNGANGLLVIPSQPFTYVCFFSSLKIDQNHKQQHDSVRWVTDGRTSLPFKFFPLIGAAKCNTGSQNGRKEWIFLSGCGSRLGSNKVWAFFPYYTAWSSCSPSIRRMNKGDVGQFASR